MVLPQMKTPAKCHAEWQQLFQECQKLTKLAYDKYIAGLKAKSPLTPILLAKKHDCCCGTLKSQIDSGMMKYQSSAQHLELTPEEEVVLVQYLTGTANCGCIHHGAWPCTPTAYFVGVLAIQLNVLVKTGSITSWIATSLNLHDTGQPL